MDLLKALVDKPAPGALYDELTRKKPKTPRPSSSENEAPQPATSGGSRKDKLKLIDARAKERYKQQKQQTSRRPSTASSVAQPSVLPSRADSPSLSPPAFASPDSVQRSLGATLTPPPPPLDKAQLRAQKRDELAAIKTQVISEMVEAEYHDKRKRLEAIDNRVRNAMKHAPNSNSSYYDLEAEANRMKAALTASLTRHRPATADTKVALLEPHTVVSYLMHTASFGKRAIEQYLCEPNNMRELSALSMKQLQASLVCYVERVQSPTHFKCEMLWRLAVVCETWPARSEWRFVCWKLAQKCYQALLDRCDGRRHAWQYAAFSAGLARVEEQLEEMELAQLMERGNRTFVFVPPDWADSSAMFFFHS